MVEVARFFDAVSYGEGDQAEVQARMVRDQVCAGVANQLAVTSGGGGFASVATGEAFVQGFWYKNTTAKLLPITSNAGASPRVDLVVLRLDRTGNTLLAVIKDGVVGAGVPVLTQVVGGMWEYPIAQISTASNVSTFTDMRVLQNIIYNPMTTPSDIIVGGAGGVPSRVAKGANNTVFGVDAAGVLGYYPVTGAMIQDRTIGGGDIALGTIQGSWAGAGTGNIMATSIHGARDIVADSITADQMAANAVGPSELADGAVNRYAQLGTNVVTTRAISGRQVTSYGYLQTTNGTVWGPNAWTYTGVNVPVYSCEPGNTIILVVFTAAVYDSVASALMYVGIGIDNASSPSYYIMVNEPVANYIMPATAHGIFTASLTGHTLYGLVFTNSGNIGVYGYLEMSVIGFHR